MCNVVARGPRHADSPHVIFKAQAVLLAAVAVASIAQLAEHALRKRMVVGSIPTGGCIAAYSCIPKNVKNININIIRTRTPLYTSVRARDRILLRVDSGGSSRDSVNINGTIRTLIMILIATLVGVPCASCPRA